MILSCLQEKKKKEKKRKETKTKSNFSKYQIQNKLQETIPMLLLKQRLGDASITLLLRNKTFSFPVCILINCNALQEEGKNYFLTLKIHSTQNRSALHAMWVRVSAIPLQSSPSCLTPTFNNCHLGQNNTRNSNTLRGQQPPDQARRAL